LPCHKTTGYLRTIHFLGEATELQWDAWVLHFTRYSGDIFTVWWTGSWTRMWNLFGIQCINNYSNWL